MKFLVSALFFLVTLSTVFGYPARDPKDDAEYIPVSRRQQTTSLATEGSDLDETYPDFKDFTGVIDTGYPSFPCGFSLCFEDIFRRLRENLFNSWWSRIPQPGDIDWDQSNGNTTSEVKIIDGHKVVVNDTVYTKKDESGNAVFRVRILNIKPLDSGENVDSASEITTIGPNNVSENDNTNNKENANDDKGSPEIIDKQPQDNEISGNIDSKEVKPSVTSI